MRFPCHKGGGNDIFPIAEIVLQEVLFDMPLRLIFMGTPDFPVPTLLELVAHGHEIAAVYTRAAKPGGRRGLTLQPTPVEQEARRLGIPVFTPATLKTPEALQELEAHAADAAVVVAYGM